MTTEGNLCRVVIQCKADDHFLVGNNYLLASTFINSKQLNYLVESSDIVLWVFNAIFIDTDHIMHTGAQYLV